MINFLINITLYKKNLFNNNHNNKQNKIIQIIKKIQNSKIPLHQMNNNKFKKADIIIYHINVILYINNNHNIEICHLKNYSIQDKYHDIIIMVLKQNMNQNIRNILHNK